MKEYKYKIRCGDDKTPYSCEKELVMKKENGSVVIRTPGSDASIVRFWPDGSVYLYGDVAESKGFHPRSTYMH